jgi:beta-glucanase (GH16 family)
MKRRTLALAVAAVAVTALLPTLASADPRPGAWRLVWSDEFSCGSVATYPDPSNWGYETGYVRNKEWQYYTKNLQNAYCKDGLLHIEAHKHPAGTYPSGSYAGQDGTISSASLISKGKIEHRYGWLEIRARIDTRLGSWPAFWTLGASGEWPDNGECDVLEYYQNKLLFNVAWWRTGDRRWTARWDSATVNVSSLAPGWVGDFHVWSMEWTPAEVRLYLDGLLYNTWDSSQDSGDRSIQGFQQPHYVIINQAIGGTAGGDASGLTYPTNYEVDWVRWYQDETNYVDDEGGAVAYAGTWGTWSGNPGYRKTEHFSEAAGSEATFTFTGDKAWYYGFKRNDLGIAEVYLDGAAAPVATIDLYSSAANYFVSLYETPQLAYGPHTLKVRVTGRKNPASAGTEIIVDGFGYTGNAGSLNQPPAFTSDPVVEANAVKGKAYIGSIGDNAVDADSDPLVFRKVTGPAWLEIASNGGLSGIPGAVDLGQNIFTVEVGDGRGGSAQAALQITVVAAGKSRR